MLCSSDAYMYNSPFLPFPLPILSPSLRRSIPCHAMPSFLFVTPARSSLREASKVYLGRILHPHVQSIPSLPFQSSPIHANMLSLALSLFVVMSMCVVKCRYCTIYRLYVQRSALEVSWSLQANILVAAIMSPGLQLS